MRMKLFMYLFFFILVQNTHAADEVELQRGAAVFMNYCSGCHSLRYFRPDSLTGNQSLMKVSMPEIDARQWFGRMPPDLSLSARERGAQWLNDYLTGFYPDHNRPFGANNRLLPDVAMPNVLYPLQGKAKLEDDLHAVVSFLVYVAEPTKPARYRLGIAVLGFLAIFGLLIYQLKRLYWRDIR